MNQYRGIQRKRHRMVQNRKREYDMIKNIIEHHNGYIINIPDNELSTQELKKIDKINKQFENEQFVSQLDNKYLNEEQRKSSFITRQLDKINQKFENKQFVQQLDHKYLSEKQRKSKYKNELNNDLLEYNFGDFIDHSMNNDLPEYNFGDFVDHSMNNDLPEHSFGDFVDYSMNNDLSDNFGDFVDYPINNDLPECNFGDFTINNDLNWGFANYSMNNDLIN